MTAASYDVISALFDDLHRDLQTGNTAAIESYFTADAVAHLSHLGSFAGGQAIAEALRSMTPSASVVRYRNTNGYISVNGVRASQSSYVLGTVGEAHVDGSIDAFLFGGKYAATYALTPGGWRIAVLRFVIDWHHGDAAFVSEWQLGAAGTRTTDSPLIVSEVDSPWRSFPAPEAGKSEEQLIAEAYIRYAWGLDQADFELMASAFTSDAEADMVPFGLMKGQREIVGKLKELRNGQPYMQHAAEDFVVSVSGDTATMEIHRIVPFQPTVETLDAAVYGARYESRLRFEDGLWKFEWLQYFPGWINKSGSL